jgi:hypothetical protein
MLTDRIIAAFTFRREVYREVEEDTTFTQTAWLLVVVVAFLNQLGSNALVGGPLRWLIGAVLGTIGAVIGFAAAAFIIDWVGRTVFSADVTFEELIRTLGLAYVWHIVGVLGILRVVPPLACLATPVVVAALILGLIAWFVAVKEALDLDWVQTIVTVILGWIALVVIWLITKAVLGLLKLTATAVEGLI